MTREWEMLKKILICSTLFFLLFFSGCTSEPQYIFFKTGVREQLQKRALKHCHGDFKILQEEKFGTYTRARLECKA